MSEETKVGRQPTNEELAKAEARKEQTAPEQPDVAGQELMRVRCWRCGTVNTVQDWWDGFWCWWCGTRNSKW